MAKIQTATITTQVATEIADIITPRREGQPTKMRLYVTGTFNGATATVQTSPDGGTTKVDEKRADGTTSIAFTANGYCDLEIPCVTSTTAEKPIKLYITTSVANPTGIVATLFDLK